MAVRTPRQRKTHHDIVPLDEARRARPGGERIVAGRPPNLIFEPPSQKTRPYGHKTARAK